MGETSFTDKRNATAAEQVITLEADRISVSESGVLKRAIRYNDIVQMRLGVEMAGRDSQVVCRITGPDKTQIVFGSRAWQSVGVWSNRGEAFRDFNSALHRALMPHQDEIDFIEGQPLWYGYVMSAIGLVIAALGFAFAVFLLRDENPIGFGGLPGALLGLYIAWMFRPRAPKHYDPALYAADNESAASG